MTYIYAYMHADNLNIYTTIVYDSLTNMVIVYIYYIGEFGKLIEVWLHLCPKELSYCSTYYSYTCTTCTPLSIQLSRSVYKLAEDVLI